MAEAEVKKADQAMLMAQQQIESQKKLIEGAKKEHEAMRVKAEQQAKAKQEELEA